MRFDSTEARDRTVSYAVETAEGGFDRVDALLRQQVAA